jgi:ATP-dependent Clp protease protease subunit
MPSNITIPMILEKVDDHPITYDLFSRMFAQRIIFFHTHVDEQTCAVAIAELLYLSALNSDPISMYINSPGGDIISGIALINTMHMIKAPVYTYCTGMAASMGAMILACGEPGNRYCLPDSEVMIHEAAGGFQGKTKDLKSSMEHIIRLQDSLYKLLAKRTGKSYEVIDQECKIDKWFTSKQALEFGLIDKILEKEEVK